MNRSQPQVGTRDRAERFYERIVALVTKPVQLMEVCGTHTMAIGRFGLRTRIPRDLRLISGPGCPVCVTPAEEVDRAIAMAREPGVSILSFGDMLRVPGSTSSLERERMSGRDIRVVYSPSDALEFAISQPDRTVVFFGIGFETTSPTVAAVLARAAEDGVDNFFVLPSFRLIPPAMEALVANGKARIDGFICPGHVSAIIGVVPYRRLATDYGVPCVITGFEAPDILEGVIMLLEQVHEGRAEVEIQYRRAVPGEGNRVALALLDRVFRRCDAHWRGLGSIPASGLEFSEAFSRFDARARVRVEVGKPADLPEGCGCGLMMQGLIVPPDCPLFERSCTPAHPVGPCMVSSEGACAAYYGHGQGTYPA